LNWAGRKAFVLVRSLLSSVVLSSILFSLNCTPIGSPTQSPQSSQYGSALGPGPVSPQPFPQPGPQPTSAAQTDLFYRTFGSRQNRPVVFVHGGAGANSFGFEESIGQMLANRGNFVVTYDQRGSGRSPVGAPGDFNFARFTRDLDDLIRTLNLRDPILIGHSWGGVLSLHFLKVYPQSAKGLIILGSPVNYPATFHSILVNAQARYESVYNYYAAGLAAQLRTQMFPNGLQPPFNYTGNQMKEAFEHASNTLLAYPKWPTAEAAKITYDIYNLPGGEWLTHINPAANTYFPQNEPGFINKSHIPLLRELRAKVHALYGNEDGFFSLMQVQEVAGTLPAGRFEWIQGAAHYPFIDERAQLLELLTKHLNQFP
jgi:proline iminopeptidase